MEWNTMWISLLTSVIGGLITGLLFYLLGGKQLAKESKRLHRLSTMILRAMEESGEVKLSRDVSGEIIGLKFDKGITARMSPMSGNLTVEEGLRRRQSDRPAARIQHLRPEMFSN